MKKKMITSSMISGTDKLYEPCQAEPHLAEEYYKDYNDAEMDFYPHSAGFVSALAAQIIYKMDLQPKDRFVDLRGGRGIFTEAILERVDFDNPVLLVDSRKDMLECAQNNEKIKRLHIDAKGFAQQSGIYDKILIKEAVDQIDDTQELFTNLYNRLSPGGVLLLVHTSPKTEKPLFKGALKKAEEDLSDPKGLYELLCQTGFEVEREKLEYPQVIPQKYYLKMVETRYTPLLHAFGEKELQTGLNEIREKYKNQETLRFNDRFDYLIAKKV